jgi:hypothetical protein
MANLEKMLGGAKVSLMSSVLVAIAGVVYFLYTSKPVHILLLLGLFGIMYGFTYDLAGSMVAASIFSMVYVIFFAKKGVHEAFSEEKKNIPPPDHGDRAEMLELGKKYKMPSEADDPEFHLDAGTTFMNAYKALKPEQVAAMTKDTQELMETQKQLMSTLQTLKPLITDGKQMMDMFQSYFGTGNPTPN